MLGLLLNVNSSRHPQSKWITQCITGSSSAKRNLESIAYPELLHF